MSRVLLIESDRPLATNLQNFLVNVGHDVQWYVDPQTAMDSADVLTPELIILDLMLADHSGVEFLYELRSYPEWENLPVVVFSGVSERELGLSAPATFPELGISAYHYKPRTSLSQLAQTIDYLLHPVSP